MPIPKWMKTVLKAMSTSDESAGEHILNKTIEKANNAKTDEERKNVYNDTAKKELAVTAASLAPKVMIEVAKSPTASKLVGETAASMLGGETLNQITKDVTGESWGRNVSGLFGKKGKEAYDKNKVMQLLADFTNPGYAATNVTKGLANKFLDDVSSSIKPDYSLGIVVGNKPEQIINSDLFKNLSTKEQNEFWARFKEIFPKQELSTLKIKDYPESSEVLQELQNVLTKRSKKSTPIQFTTDAEGNMIIIPGNLEEIARYHWGIGNGKIKPGEKLITRGHGVNEQMGLGKSKDIWFGGEGDEGLVLPYTYWAGKDISKDMVSVNPKGLNFERIYTDKIIDWATSKTKEINAALKAKDFKRAAESYSELLQVPILQKPFLQQRIPTIGTVNPRDGITSANMLMYKSFPKDRVLLPDLNSPGYSIFTGYTGEHPYLTGGYYIKPGAQVAIPELELSKWKFYPNSDKESIAEINEYLRSQGLPEKWNGITTDYIGKMYRDFTGTPITKIRVGDFHYVLDNGKQPYLYMVPKQELNKLYRVDQYKIGLKHGGRFKNPLHK